MDAVDRGRVSEVQAGCGIVVADLRRSVESVVEAKQDVVGVIFLTVQLARFSTCVVRFIASGLDNVTLEDHLAVLPEPQSLRR